MCAARQHPTRGDVVSVDYADRSPDPAPETRTGPFQRRIPGPDERVAIRLVGHPVTYVVRATSRAASEPHLTELTMIADDGHAIDYDAVRAVPVRRLAHTAAQWIARAGGLVGFPDDTAEAHTQPENHDPRIWRAAQIAERALSLGLSVRPTVAAELNVSKSTVDRLLRRAKAEGWLDGQELPKRPPPQQRDRTTTDPTREETPR